MTYTPSQNEIIISGVPIVSGGENFGPEPVIIPTEVSSASQFYVKSVSDGSYIEVDAATAAQLYSTSIAINELNSLYGPGQAYLYPTLWQQVATQVQIDFAGENLIGVAEGFVSQLPSLLPEAVGLAVPGVDAVALAGIIEGIVSTSLTVGTTSYTNNLGSGLTT